MMQGRLYQWNSADLDRMVLAYSSQLPAMVEREIRLDKKLREKLKGQSPHIRYAYVCGVINMRHFAMMRSTIEAKNRALAAAVHDGMRQAEVSRLLGMTRQRVHQIMRKAGAE